MYTCFMLKIREKCLLFLCMPKKTIKFAQIFVNILGLIVPSCFDEVLY